jgi:putative membrane protein
MTTKPLFNLAVATALILGALSAGTSVGHASDGPTDAQIVGIVLAANQIDIDYGKLALAKSQNKQVREFAQRMITDHSAVQQSVRELAAKLGVRAADSPTSESLKKSASEITARLKALDDQEFDQLYVDNEVSYHEVVTGAVDTVLIPSARNPELKSALQGAQPLFLKHLEHVRQIQASGHGMMSHGE